MSNSLRPHEWQHARPPCPSPFPEFTQTQVHQVSDAIQPSHPLSSPFPPGPNPSQPGHHQFFMCIHALCSQLQWITICPFHPLDADQSKRTPSSFGMNGHQVLWRLSGYHIHPCHSVSSATALVRTRAPSPGLLLHLLPQLLASNPSFSSFFFVIAPRVIFWTYKSEFVRSLFQTLPNGLKHKV